MRLTQWFARLNLPQLLNGRLVLLAIAFLTGLLLVFGPIRERFMRPALSLLSDPFLQLPTATSVRVVWFTEFAGDRHTVTYGVGLQQTATAATRKLSQVQEDAESKVGQQTEEGSVYAKPTKRDIWRHEAEITGLTPGQRVPYRVASATSDGLTVNSQEFTLAPLPAPGIALKILLTSDHQLMPMTATNLQKVVETVGQVDGVFLAGDLVNIPDRASEWFDDNRGGAFFPCLQGRAHYDLERDGVTTRYSGGAIIQYAPLFPAVGNHEVMGRRFTNQNLGDQFGDPYPRAATDALYAQKAASLNPNNDATVQATWLKQNTFNSDTYEEIFSLPETSPGSERYYAVTFGDVRLIVLYATNIWRSPSLNASTKGRYREQDDDLENPERWGNGQHIFEAIASGTPQYNWLLTELNSPEFQQAKYRLVMFHHPPHSLGDNIVPAYTDPIQFIDRFPNGQIKAVRYEYPLQNDYLIRDVMPVLDAAGVQLVHYGHSHLWNRFISPTGMHFLETSNVGNTYGAFLAETRRPIPIGFNEVYAATGDPNKLEPIVPAIAPLLDQNGTAQPYIASDDHTVFSIFDTGTGTVSSYYFDTRQPTSAVVKFDEFQLK